MKKALFAVCLAPMMALGATSAERGLLDTARELGWPDADLERLEAVCATNRARRIAAADARKAAEQSRPKPDPTLERLRADAKARARRYAVLRRTVTIHQPGRTNLVVRAMASSLADKIAEARQLAESWKTQWQSATNRAEIAEARAARADAARAWLVSQRDKATLPSTKAIYQAIIDRLDAAE